MQTRLMHAGSYLLNLLLLELRHTGLLRLQKDTQRPGFEAPVSGLDAKTAVAFSAGNKAQKKILQQAELTPWGRTGGPVCGCWYKMTEALAGGNSTGRLFLNAYMHRVSSGCNCWDLLGTGTWWWRFCAPLHSWGRRWKRWLWIRRSEVDCIRLMRLFSAFYTSVFSVPLFFPK